MHAEIQLSPANADYARRIELVGSLITLAEKIVAAERAILIDDWERRHLRDQSPSPLNRDVAMIAIVR
jgi:hypothetical protein